MSGTEACRKLSNALGLKPNVVFFEFPPECNIKYTNIARDKLPSAYFITIGKCRNNAGVSVTNIDLVHTSLEAFKYAYNNSFFVFEFADTTHYTQIAGISLGNFIKELHEEFYVIPIIINYAPRSFMQQTKLQPSDAVFVSKYGRNPNNYAAIIDSIANDVITTGGEPANISEINQRLTSNKPLIFSNTSWQIADAAVFMLMMYSTYQMYRLVKNHNKYKIE